MGSPQMGLIFTEAIGAIAIKEPSTQMSEVVAGDPIKHLIRGTIEDVSSRSQMGTVAWDLTAG